MPNGRREGAFVVMVVVDTTVYGHEPTIDSVWTTRKAADERMFTLNRVRQGGHQVYEAQVAVFLLDVPGRYA